MTSRESYGLTSAEYLRMHLVDIDTQCEATLERYKALLVQRGIVLEALNEVLTPHVLDLELIAA
jgi:hypothetical protein